MVTATCAAANAANIYVKADGTCVKECDDYIKAKDDDKTCNSEKCAADSKWTNFDGTCVATNDNCKNYSKKDATNDKKCIKDSCTSA